MTDTNTTLQVDATIPTSTETGSGKPVSHVDSEQEAAKGYTPVFNDMVRTIIYVVGLVASVVGLGFMTFGLADIGGFISTAAGFIAASFGVAYNPLRLSSM